MAFNFTFQFNKLLRNGEKISNSVINQVITSITATLAGLVGNSDMATTAVRNNVTVPDAYWFANATGVAGVYSLTLNSGLAAYSNGLVVAFKADTANTGAVNLNINAIGSADLFKENGTELEAGEIPANYIVTARYNSSNSSFQVLSILGLPAVYRAGLAGGTANALTHTLTPSSLTLALLDKRLILAKAASANTDVVTYQVNALVAKPIRKENNQALAPGDIAGASQWLTLMYDSVLDVFLLLSPPAARDTAIVAACRNLLVANNGAAPNNKLDISADEVVLKSSTQAMVASSVAVTVDITASGANGLDTGAEAASVYYVWLIYNPGTATKASLLSLSATAPTLPSGYTFKALVGMVNNATGSNFWTMYQQDRTIYINDTNVLADLAATTPATFQSLSVSTVAPPIAKRVFGTAGSGDVAQPARLSLAGNSAGTLACCDIFGQQNGAASPGGFRYASRFELPLVTAQTIYWTSANAADRNRINISGFTI